MMIFPNLGFMGIPLVRSLYGEEAVIFVAFYIVGYNLLVYSYGILLAMGTRDDCEDAGKEAAKRAGLPWKKMLNIGMGACITAILYLLFTSGCRSRQLILWTAWETRQCPYP